jgi:hypothetical protein
MKLDFIDLGKLSISKTNMRYGKKAPDVTDILPTIRARGVLVPLIVRPNCAEGAYEIVAGRGDLPPLASSRARRAKAIRCPAPYSKRATMPPRSKPR